MIDKSAQAGAAETAETGGRKAKVAEVADVEAVEADSNDWQADGTDKSKGEERYPMREVSFDVFGTGTARFNPLTTFIGIAILWGLAIYCAVEPEAAKTGLVLWRKQTTAFFTWFYIGTQPLFMFFVIFIAIRYGNIKLGREDEEPEFSNVTYFAMLFSAGVAVGLFFFGVSEPLWHQTSHWFAEAYGITGQDSVDMFAMNQTFYHWGLAAWAPYLVVALAASLASYRYNLPMTFRSAFYPILGEHTWGWIGDLIDGFTIVTVVSGVCTSLGLGAMQIVAGLQRVGAFPSWDGLDADELADAQVTAQAVTIAVVTLVATVSVVSGLNVGIKYLSQFAFGVGMCLWFLVLVLDRTSYLLNLSVQGFGYYMQWSIFQINFWTDAFGQLKPGEGRAVDGKAASASFMDGWTVFYMAWWTAWSSFVGLFIARISRGRRVRDVVVYSFVGPLFYSILWFSVFGGAGLRQSRQALEVKAVGSYSFNNSDYFLVEGTTCYDADAAEGSSYMDGDAKAVTFTSATPGVSPVCLLDADNGDSAWFNVLYSYHNYGPFLSVLSLVAISIYFVTSSDSGSLIVDHLASNGRHEHHWLQRIFWAFTEGAVAIALLFAGGAEALQALQAASIVAGLPFTVLLVFLCQTIWIMCADTEKKGALATFDLPRNHAFAQPIYGGILNVFEWVASLGSIDARRVDAGIDAPTGAQVVLFFKALFAPFVGFLLIQRQLGGPKLWVYGSSLFYFMVFVLWIALFASVNAPSAGGIVAFAWTAFFVNACLLANVRGEVRARFNIRGNVAEDFFASLILYPQVLSQCEYQFDVSPVDGSDKAE